MSIILCAQEDYSFKVDSAISQIEEDFITYHGSLSFTSEEEEKIKQLMLNKGREILVIEEDAELSEYHKGQAIDALHQDCMDEVLKIKQFAKYREKSKQEVLSVDSVVSLSDIQMLQLEAIWHGYYMQVVKTYGDSTMEEFRRACKADLHDKVRLVLSSEQLSGYYKSISREQAKSRTDEQMSIIASKEKYSEIQLSEMERFLYRHNLEQEVIREKYRFKTEKKYAEIRNHRKNSSAAVKKLLALTREDAVRQYVGNYQWKH